MTKSPINPLKSEKCTEKRTPLVRPDVKRMTYDHQSGRDLRVKTRVWTFSPQIDEFGGRLAYYFNAAPIFCALCSPDLGLCVLLLLKPFLSCHTAGALVPYITVPLSGNKNARRGPRDKPPCPSLHVTTHCELKVEASNRLSRSMLALINRPHVPATQHREQASITDELPLVYVFLLNNLCVLW